MPTNANIKKANGIKIIDARLTEEEQALQACDIEALKESIKEAKEGKTTSLREIIARGRPRTVK